MHVSLRRLKIKPMRSLATLLPEDPARIRWRALVLLAIYHLALGTALVIIGERPGFREAVNVDPELFATVARIILFISPVLVTLSLVRRPTFYVQVHGILLFDVVLLTWLMHAAGGAGSGFGLLLAISLAIGVLLTTGKTPFLFAALASSAVIIEQIYAFSTDQAPLGSFLHAGLLGIAFFSIGFLDFVLSRRLQATEQIIQRQELDLENLNAINEFVIGLLDLGVVVVDAEDRVKTLNQTAKHWFGVSDVFPSQTVATLDQGLGEVFSRWRRQPMFFTDPDPMLEVSGRELGIEFIALGEPSHQGALILVRDMDRVRAEAHRVKLAAIGQMSAGIAHELRNPLSAISQGAQLLHESETLQSQDRQIANMLIRNSHRLNGVVENVLSLSQKRDPARKTIPLCSFVDKVTEQMSATPLTAKARITTHCRNNAQALMDPKHLEEVLNILVENAIRHAQPGTDPEVTIEVDLNTDGKPVIDVRDNGPGIMPEIARKIFDPFFSTSIGTGLGLFLARQFCDANRASLKLDTQKSLVGALFRITLSPPPRQAP